MIEKNLQDLCPFPLSISWHENKSSYLSFRKERRCISLRLHRLFLASPTSVHEALIQYIVKGDRKAKAVVRQAAHLYFSKTQAKPRPLKTKGKVYDLQALYDQLKDRFFSPDFHAFIGWSIPPRKSRFRHMTFGAYDRHRRQIRIHPFLDNAQVPHYFLTFIVYHEMLHGICEPHLDARGHSRCHTAEFRKLEKQFPDYQKAKEWEKGSLLFFKKRGKYEPIRKL